MDSRFQIFGAKTTPDIWSGFLGNVIGPETILPDMSGGPTDFREDWIMPTIVGILIFMSRKNFMLSWVEKEIWLSFHLHHMDASLHCKNYLFHFWTNTIIILGVSNFRFVVAVKIDSDVHGYKNCNFFIACIWHCCKTKFNRPIECYVPFLYAANQPVNIIVSSWHHYPNVLKYWDT